MALLGKVVQKFKQVRFRYLKKFLNDHLNKESKNCVYNRSTTFSQSGCDNVGLCAYGFEEKTWLGGACDSRVNPELAKGCEDFESLYKKDDLKKVFNDFLETSDLPAISKHYPDLATLMWVLDQAEINIEDSEEE